MKGSSALKQKMTVLSDEDLFQDLRREHDEVLTQVITRDGLGEVIKSTGDGLLAVFTEPSVAVERALEIQEKLYRHPYLRVRIGLDMGQVRAEAAGGVQRDLFGRHVDWAARAESLADGGHILVTRSVYPDAFGWIPKPRVSWKEHGFYVVKDGEPAMEVFEPYNRNITGPLERLHGKKVSGSWQHRLNDGIRTSLRLRANRFLLSSMVAAIVVLGLIMYVPQRTWVPTPEGRPKASIESPRPSVSDNFASFKEVYAYASAPLGMTMPPADAKQFAETWVLECKNKNFNKFMEVYAYASAPLGMTMPPAKAREYALQMVDCP